MAAAFELAANGLLPPAYPQLGAGLVVRTIPPSVLGAVGWVESGWRQFTPQGRPLVSFDFGYGIMQVTSGMAGAFGDVYGQIDPAAQSEIASNYRYNIAYGAQMLAKKWATTPPLGNRDPAIVENWYYALWAYNGWGWVNNPNNPRFTRAGTPASNPSTYPYQERVLYLVAHPPRDRDGNPLWAAISVSLPPKNRIGAHPGPLTPSHTHRQDPSNRSAVYLPSPLHTVPSSGVQSVSVRLTNTGALPWLAAGDTAVSLVYHLFTSAGNPWQPFSPFSTGVVSLGQGQTPLTQDVVPGKSTTVHVTVTAPAKPGNYRLAWDLEQGAGLWFSQSGAPPRVQKLHVTTENASAPPPSPTLTPMPQVKEHLDFVADTSVADGSPIGPRQRFAKGWLVFNDGKSDWQRGWALHLVSGSPMGARRIQVPPTRACRSANIVESLVAPRTPGTYKSVWQMQDPQGHTFAQKLTLLIIVRGSGPRPTPVPSPPAPKPTRTPVAATPTPVG